MNFRRNFLVTVGILGALLLALPQAPTAQAATFQINARVKVVNTGSLAVRDTPSLTGVLLGTRPSGALGTIIGGSVVASGYTWWQINWDDVSLVGWSAQTYLSVVSAPTSTAIFDFSLLTSGNISLKQGSSTTKVVTASLVSGTAQSVSFSVSGLPSGATANFSPTACIPTCLTSMGITIGASTPLGTYPTTVTGIGGGVTKTTSFSLTVVSGSTSTTGFDFSLSNSGSITVNQGSAASKSITASLVSGTAQNVSFSTSGLPAGATASFSPTACTPTCSTSMGLSVGASTPTGNYTVTVTGTAGSVIKTTSFTLAVASPSTGFDFSLSNSGSITVNQGSSAAKSITASLVSGTAQNVSFSTSGLPAGATASFSPTACTPTCSTSMGLSVGASTPTGNYTVTVTGTAGSVTKTTSFTLTVASQPTTGTLTVTSPAGGEYWPLGLQQLVSWTNQSLPAGSYISINLVNATNPSIIVRPNLETDSTNDGQEEVTIPADITATNYRIQIVAVTPDSQNITTSSKIFSVVKPSIAVTSPTLYQIWYLASTSTVTWNNNYVSPNASIAISIVNSSDLSLVENLVEGIPNTGTAQVFVPIMTPGTYKVQVVATEPGGLETPGNSPLMYVRTPAARVISPTTGSKWYYKNKYTVTWSATGTPSDATARLELVLNNTEQTISDNLTPQDVSNTGSAEIEIPVPSNIWTGLYKIKLTMMYRGEDLLTVSSNAFSVTQPPLTFLSPTTGSKWYFGTRETIRWHTTSTPDNTFVKLTLIKTDISQTFVRDLTDGSVPNTENAEIVVRLVPAANYKVKLIMTTLDDEIILSATSVAFAVGESPLTFITPTATTTWFLGRDQTVRWSATGTVPDALVDLILVGTDAAQTPADIPPLAQQAPNNGSSTFFLPPGPLTPPDLPSKQYKVKLNMFFDEEIVLSETSAAFYVAPPPLPITLPAASTTWTIGTMQNLITWTKTAIPPDSLLAIEFVDARTTSTVIERVASEEPNDGSAIITVPPDLQAGDYRIKLIAYYHDEILTNSFSPTIKVIAPTIMVTSPAQGEVWYLGTLQTARWVNNSVPSSSLMALAFVNQASEDPIADFGQSPNNEGFLAKIVPSIATGTYQIRVQADHPDGQRTIGLSAPFSLAAAPITVAVANTTWPLLQTRSISWQATINLPASTRIALDLVNDINPDDTVSIASDLPNNGSYSYLIPSDVNPGSYRVLLTASDDTGVLGMAFSNPISVILPSFTFSSPVSGAVWKPGSQQTISWQSSFVPASADVKVRLSLVTADTLDFVVQLGEEEGLNSGTRTISVPAIYQDTIDPLATSYRVKIETSYPDGRGTAAVSDPITYAPPAIRITSPGAGARWIVGVPQSVSWTNDPAVVTPTTVSLTLVPASEDGYEVPLTEGGISNSGTANIGALTAATGTYRIRLVQYLNDQEIAVVQSDAFLVDVGVGCVGCHPISDYKLVSERLNNPARPRAKMKVRLVAPDISIVKKVQYRLDGGKLSTARKYPYNWKFKTNKPSVTVGVKITFVNGEFADTSFPITIPK